MNVTVIGTGFVGVVSAAVFAQYPNQVIGLDIDAQKITQLNRGKIPFYEPQLAELVQKGLTTGKLHFTTDYLTSIPPAQVIIIAVGTPSAPDGQADLSYVFAAAKSMAPHLAPDAIIAIKSTVPPGTDQKLSELIKPKTKVRFYTAALPEFLKEGSAVTDTLNPDRIVIGATDPFVITTLLKLHRPLKGKRIIVSPQSAQLSKYAANAYLAQRITFINQMANLCEKTGADIQEIIQAIGPDKRIGSHYWYPGLGYGGSCFPKDVRELAAYSKAIGEGDGLFVKIDELNEKRISKMMDKWGKKVNGWQKKQVAVLGLSFKPNTDDLREAPSLKIIPYLKQSGASIVAYDPQAMPHARRQFPHLTVAASPYQAIKGADIVMVLIEWPELINLDITKIKQHMAGNIFIDARNQYDPQTIKQAGLVYIGVGRS